MAASPAFAALSAVALVCTVGLMALLGPGLATGLFTLVVTVLGVGALLVLAALPIGMYVDTLQAGTPAGESPETAAKRGATGIGAYLLVAAGGWLLTGPVTATLCATVTGALVASGVAVDYLRARAA